jgi:hypothetical protein
MPFVIASGAVEQRADDAVMEINNLIDDRRPGFENSGDQCGIATRGLKLAHVLGGHLTALACQLQESVLVDLAFDSARKRQGFHHLEPIDVFEQVLGVGRTRWLAEPDERADFARGSQIQQRVELPPVLWRQGSGQ